MSQEEEKKTAKVNDARCDAAASSNPKGCDSLTLAPLTLAPLTPGPSTSRSLRPDNITSIDAVSKIVKLSANYNSDSEVKTSNNESIIVLNNKRKLQNLSGPIQVIDGAVIESANPCELDHPAQGPLRRYECSNYETCLKIAAALNWDSFTCRGCNSQINENLLWRAQHAVHKDKTVKAICDLPDPRCRKIESGNQSVELKLLADKVSGN